MENPTYKPFYDEMRTGVTRQASEVEEVRSAAGRALGVGALVVSVTGIGSFGGGFGEVVWGAVVVLLAVGVGLTVYIWWPRRVWRFELGASDAIAWMLEDPDDPLSEDEVYREFALHLEADFDSNEVQLRKLQRGLRWLLVVVGWLILLVLLLSTVWRG